MRAMSILLMLMHLYWYCYSFFLHLGITHNVVDRILINFNQTTDLFSHLLYTKLFCLILLSLSLWGGKGVKHEKITVSKITLVFTVGFSLFFFNFFLLDFEYSWSTILYIATLTQGMFIGAVSDNFDERIEQKKFHCEIVVGNDKVSKEMKAYQKILQITSFLDAHGNNTLDETI